MSNGSPEGRPPSGYEPLKNQFGPEIPRRIGRMIADVYPPFAERAFVRDALRGYEELELTPRGWHIARALRSHLPEHYPDAAAILVSSLGERATGELTGMGSFVYMPHAFFVAEYGLDHLEESLEAQYEITQRFTAEFSIRPFLVGHRDATLARLQEWTTDPSMHVRRLVSEGTRPRLPWAPVLREFVTDPSPVVALLELLKDDPALYVRRSVANNLNDISKDHPDTTVEVCKRWMGGATPERAWLVKHALRTLIKRGNPGALAVLGFGEVATVSLDDVAVTPRSPRIGESARVEFTVTNDGLRLVALLIDLRVHFVKARGDTSAKVFKLTTVELDPGESTRIGKTVALHQQTTRTHHAGLHEMEVLVNGVPLRLGSFVLRPPPGVRSA